MNNESSRRERDVAPGVVVLVLLALMLAACVPGPDESDAGRGDAGTQKDAGVPKDGGAPKDAGPDRDSGVPEPGRDGGPSDGGSNDGDPKDEHGFAIRVPQLRTVPCTGQFCPSPSTLRDEDYVCTFKAGSVSGFVYAQATPVRMTDVSGGTFESAGSWVSIDGRVSSVQSSYDYGGNHHNDSLTFTYAGQSYRYYHSSFGFGWRACQPMDCVQEVAGDAVLKDGCGPDRSLPIVCARVTDDGKVPALVDSFQKCVGDPNRK